MLFLPYIHKHRQNVVLLAVDPTLRVLGTRIVAENMRPEEGALLRVRSRLRQGDMVCTMLETNPGPRALAVPSRRHEIYVAPAIVHLAQRCGARVFLTAGRLDDAGEVLLTVAEMPDGVAPELVDASIVEFFARHLAAVERALDSEVSRPTPRSPEATVPSLQLPTGLASFARVKAPRAATGWWRR
jgi:hypothetical protein